MGIVSETQNNIQLVLKPMENRQLNEKQNFAKMTLTQAHNVIGKLTQIIEEREEQLSTNYRAYISQSVKLKKESMKVLDLEKELEELKKRNAELTEANEKLKENLSI